MIQFLETNDRSQRVGHIDLKLEDDSYSLLENETVTKTYEVDIIRISDYIKDVVANREIPTGDKGSVVMKLDVEVIYFVLLLKKNSLSLKGSGNSNFG